MLVKPCHKPPKNRNGNLYHRYIYGDDWGMVYDCFMTISFNHQLGYIDIIYVWKQAVEYCKYIYIYKSWKSPAEIFYARAQMGSYKREPSVETNLGVCPPVKVSWCVYCTLCPCWMSGCRIVLLSGWWFQPLWKILVSWAYYSQYMENKNMFQTTNQVLLFFFVARFLLMCQLQTWRDQSPKKARTWKNRGRDHWKFGIHIPRIQRCWHPHAPNP